MGRKSQVEQENGVLHRARELVAVEDVAVRLGQTLAEQGVASVALEAYVDDTIKLTVERAIKGKDFHDVLHDVVVEAVAEALDGDEDEDEDGDETGDEGVNEDDNETGLDEGITIIELRDAIDTAMGPAVQKAVTLLVNSPAFELKLKSIVQEAIRDERVL